MPTPLSSQCLVVEALDLSKTAGPGELDDIFPILETLQDIDGESVELLPSPFVLENFPHTEKSIYTLFGMSIGDSGDGT